MHFHFPKPVSNLCAFHHFPESMCISSPPCRQKTPLSDSLSSYVSLPQCFEYRKKYLSQKGEGKAKNPYQTKNPHKPTNQIIKNKQTQTKPRKIPMNQDGLLTGEIWLLLHLNYSLLLTLFCAASIFLTFRSLWGH